MVSIAEAFTSFTAWNSLFLNFILILGAWISIKTYRGAGRLSEERALAVQGKFEAAGGCGSFVITSTTWLLVLQIVRSLALWLTFTFYQVTGPTEDPTPLPGEPQTTFFCTIWQVTLALIFTGTVFHLLTEAAFYDVGWFGTAFGLRVVEGVAFLAALVAVIVELACLPAGESYGEEVALLIVLIVIFIHEILVLLPRNYLFFHYDDKKASVFDDSARLVPSQATPSGVYYPGFSDPIAHRAAAVHQQAWTK